jgi:rhamnogalacturonan endolyase
MKLLFNLVCLAVCLWVVLPAVANVPGGGTGSGPNVTLTDNGDGTVTMANGIVSIVITKTDATIHTINYTYNNSGSPTTYQVLSGGNNGGQLYWEFGGFSAGSAAYSVVANTGNYAEVAMLFSSASSGTIDIHFSMLRGSTGFYATPVWSHRASDAAMGMGETRDNIYISPTFTWNSIDDAHNFQYNTGGSAVGVGGQGAPVEVSLWTNGIAAGRYEDKYKYCADFGTERVWGWSSVNNPAAGVTGRNIGIWHVLASAEFYNGGPMKPELMCAPMVNMLNGGHYQMGSDSQWGAGEVWTRVSGPYFIYLNSVTNTLTNPYQTAQALFSDAKAQAQAEATAWPYNWFNYPNYAPAANRGTVSGQLVINDSGNPNATASNLWVGVVRQPVTVSGVYDFQQWMKPYQFWVQTDANGNFTIPHVIATNNYTLYAFGQGANGTFMSQNQTGGNPPLLYNLPASPFSVTVTGGVTNNLGAITWTPSRVGATVFEIGYPDRTSKKFRHGDDWWVGDVGPSPTNPMPVWSKFLEYPFDFPNGPNYIVGQSRWSTDWNFVQPNVVDSAGNYNSSSSTITFNLATAPANGAAASLYIATASDDAGPLIVTVNGSVLVGTIGGVTASPSILTNTGYFPQYSSSDTTIRDGVSAVFSDERINFPASYLHAGQNTINLNMRKGGSLNNHAMYDYLRLELTGYVPPPPASVAAYAGNNCNLVSWPVTPGATSYNLLRSTFSGSGYVSITNGVNGPVCGSGFNNATWLDTNAVNGTTYYYVVQSVNPGGASTNSPESSGATPNSGISTSAPAAPNGLAVGSVAHHSVTLNWSAASGASFYTIYRSTLVDTLGGASNTLSTIVLNNNTTGTTCTDTSPTDGTIYRYFVSATGVGGTSGYSSAVIGTALPAPPAAAPGSFTGIFNSSSIVLNWSPVSGAVGYIIRHATNAAGPFIYVQNVTETAYVDGGLDPTLTYYYRVTAVNAAGVSPNATLTVVSPPLAPISLSAFPGDTQVTLNWTTVPGVMGYYLYAGTSSGNETNLVVGNYSGTTFTNTALTNGVTYYYVVASTNINGLGPNSPEASATPNANIVFIPRSLIWRGDGAANIWDASGAANCQTNNISTIFNNGDTLIFDNTGSNNVPVVVAGTPQPALVTFNASKNYTLNGPGAISGTNQLIKTGSGMLTINNTNLYSGGTLISNSTVYPGNIGANSSAWGSGPITLAGGTIQFNGYNGSVNTGFGGCVNTINVPAGQTGTLLLPPRWGYSSPFTSPLTGGGTVTVTVAYVRNYFSGDWSAFTGLINVNGTGDFRIDNNKGYANAAIYLNSGVNFYNVNANGQTTDIGELGGGVTAFIGAGSLSSVNPTWRIGAKNTTNTYAGTIADAGVTSLIKTGTGSFILSGANAYSGGTTISGGALVVSNSAGSATGSGTVSVNSGGRLGGNGIISGAVTVNSNGALALDNSFGILTLSNNLMLAAGSTTFMRVQHSPLTNSAVKVLGTLTEGGTLNVALTGGVALANGDSFKLFNAAGYAGSFASYVLPALTGNLVWNTNTLKNSGTLSVVTLTSPTIASINIIGGNLVLSGSGGVNGWPYYVLASTNLTTAQWTSVATNQFDAAGNFTVTNAINPNFPQTFYRLQLQ